MARPILIKDETILDAARLVFLERGIRATTAEVAVRAGVSEGSVFKRYKSKFELFRAAMFDSLQEPAWLADINARVGKGDVQKELVALGIEIIEFFRAILPLMMMSWSNPGPDGLSVMLAGPNPPPIRAVRKMTAYFQAEMKLGRLRRTDAEIVARAFLGSLNHFVFSELILKDLGELPLAREPYVRGLVQLLFTGLAAEAGTKPKASSKREARRP
jgi:AcrR family transcriptional regulator